MTNITKLSLRQPSLFSTVRVQADVILGGPQNVLWASEKEGDPPYYGWPVLLLEKMRAAPIDQVESRCVYANLLDNTQQFAVLRAVTWDGGAVRKIVREQEQNFKLVMPARFVKLPVERLKVWLSKFESLRVILNNYTDDDTVTIRRLRIKQDYVHRIFEKVWQTQDTDHTILNQQWSEVWVQMTEVLAIEPSVINLEEDFWFVNPKIVYDFQAYQPDQFTLE